LKFLRLTHSKLTGTQLLNFIRSPRPCLIDLSLFLVSGFTNNDLLIFLLEVSSTLTYLTMTLLRLDKSPDEEHAIDVAIAKMDVLEGLSIKGDLASTLVITRKPPTKEHSNRPYRTAIWRHPLYSGGILLSNCPHLNGDDLQHALTVTGWRRVWLCVQNRENFNETHKKWARDICVARNIEFYAPWLHFNLILTFRVFAKTGTSGPLQSRTAMSEFEPIKYRID
jgi:hypothetical protein